MLFPCFRDHFLFRIDDVLAVSNSEWARNPLKRYESSRKWLRESWSLPFKMGPGHRKVHQPAWGYLGFLRLRSLIGYNYGSSVGLIWTKSAEKIQIGSWTPLKFAVRWNRNAQIVDLVINHGHGSAISVPSKSRMNHKILLLKMKMHAGACHPIGNSSRGFTWFSHCKTHCWQ